MSYIKEIESLISDIDDILDSLIDPDYFSLFIDLFEQLINEMNELYRFILQSDSKSKNECYITFQSSTGGLESENLSYVMFKEYLLMLDKNKLSYELIDIDINGDLLKKAVIHIKEKNAYSFFKNEKGLHRFTRISPYGNGKLHTSFVYIDVYPVIDDSYFIDIKKTDLRIDTFRGSGAGGQHRNTTDSAVRITHIPTNTVVKIESERSQHTNKKMAMNLLISKLESLNIENNNSLKSDKVIQDWGSQIRSYTLEQNRIKEHRCSYTYNGNLSNYFSTLFKNIKDVNTMLSLHNFKC